LIVGNREKHLRDRIVNLSLRYREDMRRKDATIQQLTSHLQRMQEISRRLLELAQQANVQVPEDLVEAVQSGSSAARRPGFSPELEPTNNGLELLATRASIVLRGNVEPFIGYGQNQLSPPSPAPPPPNPSKRMRRSRSSNSMYDAATDPARQPPPAPRAEVDYRDVIAWMRSQPSQT
jgi:hypothetical protein